MQGREAALLLPAAGRAAAARPALSRVSPLSTAAGECILLSRKSAPHLKCFFFSSCSLFPAKGNGIWASISPKWSSPSQSDLEGPCQELFEAVALPAVWCLSIHLQWKHRVGFIPSYSGVTLPQDDLEQRYGTAVSHSHIMNFRVAYILSWLCFHERPHRSDGYHICYTPVFQVLYPLISLCSLAVLNKRVKKDPF